MNIDSDVYLFLRAGFMTREADVLDLLAPRRWKFAAQLRHDLEEEARIANAK